MFVRVVTSEIRCKSKLKNAWVTSCVFCWKTSRGRSFSCTLWWKDSLWWVWFKLENFFDTGLLYCKSSLYHYLFKIRGWDIFSFRWRTICGLSPKSGSCFGALLKLITTPLISKLILLEPSLSSTTNLYNGSSTTYMYRGFLWSWIHGGLLTFPMRRVK